MKRLALLAAVVLLLASSRELSAAEQAPMGWPEVISSLTTERTQAETCVGLIKSRGTAASIESAKTTYLMTKGEMDGVIAGLETVLGEGGKPGSLPTVRPSLEAVASNLKAICATAYATSSPNTKGIWDELAKGVAEGAIEPIVNKISDGVTTIWTHYVIEPDKLALETRKAKLEAARWPEFDDIAKK